ncbi:hypothetical protein HYN59_06180 [Flavobacterium album]|uniref:Glycosidase n=1 Tax=Flavobacterium album TaxID=2175091 RepID=A0A2S1QWH3_9FLAO|nr:hypothetical protein [Flavobacterium album]AWH84733.1 hypothetical protein HYN59_06180 [Flavobacterium album]
MSRYTVKKIEPLELECTAPLAGMYKLSPYVWKEKHTYKMLIRAVNPSDDVTQQAARAYFGTSKDGLNFKMDDGPCLAPSTQSYDKDGCEDPSVILFDRKYYVYYTGWNVTKREGQLMLATGDDPRNLKVEEISIASKEPYLNPKEATLTRLKNGMWALFFEYAQDGRSKLGRAFSKNPDGPWRIEGEFLQARDDSWDSYHLSAGPALVDKDFQTVMFYNGSNPQAHWRIGWVEMDDHGKITARSEEPLITPPASKPGQVDIAFSASNLRDGNDIWLYYSTEDQQPFRAIISVEGP